MVDDLKEDVKSKRAKIDLMTLGTSEGRCHGHRPARRGHRADEGAEEGLATSVRWVVSGFIVAVGNREWGTLQHYAACLLSVRRAVFGIYNWWGPQKRGGNFNRKI